LAAAEKERRRWAHELHDETMQSLTALAISLALARSSAEQAELPQAVDRAIEALESSMSDLRGLITELRPAALSNVGIGPAIEALAERMERHGMQVTVDLDLAYEAGRLPSEPELDIVLYRIVQEALANAWRHGHAERVALTIHDDGASLRIRVADDGAGFDPVAAPRGSGPRDARKGRGRRWEARHHIESRHGHHRRDHVSADGTQRGPHAGPASRLRPSGLARTALPALWHAAQRRSSSPVRRIAPSVLLLTPRRCR
jgi:signal transduction histidine kinase